MVLHPVENRVQGRDPNLQLVAGAALQLLADLVPVAWLSFEDGEDQKLEASTFELGIEDGRSRLSSGCSAVVVRYYASRAQDLAWILRRMILHVT
jgi:hypothetical protein